VEVDLTDTDLREQPSELEHLRVDSVREVMAVAVDYPGDEKHRKPNWSTAADFSPVAC
jgi:hypothetical protein